MRASDLVLETASAFNSNRARSLLTILGIVIGIAAVIAMTALIGGMKVALVGEMGLSQARLVYIGYYGERPMTTSDLDAMADELRNYYEAITGTVYGSGDVVSTEKKADGSIMGVYADYAHVMGLKMAQGRFITDEEEESNALVVVLSEPDVRTLFGSPTEQVVGKSVRIAGADYEIVGVIAENDTGGQRSYVDVLVPFSTCAQRIAGRTDVDQVLGLAREDVEPEKAGKAADAWLTKRFNLSEDEDERPVYISTMKSIIDQLDTMMASFQMLMTVVASVSLVVGGIGIMNMMLTNVTERIREIGLRKALGARRRDITRQFLLESVCLTLVGGVVGIALGYFGAFALAGLAGDAFGMTAGMDITPVIGLDSIALVAGICIAIGVVFGYYPARRAARLDPVESLHYQ